MSFPKADFYLVVDLEATCDENNALSGLDRECIEIGAVLVRYDNYQVVGEFQTFVQPTIHPVLTDFCTQLTHIEQHQVEAAPKFPQAIKRLVGWLGGRSTIFCSWGDYDKYQLRQDAALHRVPEANLGPHLNLKKLFADQHRCRPLGMAKALARVKLPLQGTHHRGIDDALNIARLLPFCLPRRA